MIIRDGTGLRFFTTAKIGALLDNHYCDVGNFAHTVIFTTGTLLSYGDRIYLTAAAKVKGNVANALRTRDSCLSIGFRISPANTTFALVSDSDIYQVYVVNMKYVLDNCVDTAVGGGMFTLCDERLNRFIFASSPPGVEWNISSWLPFVLHPGVYLVPEDATLPHVRCSYVAIGAAEVPYSGGVHVFGDPITKRSLATVRYADITTALDLLQTAHLGKLKQLVVIIYSKKNNCGAEAVAILLGCLATLREFTKAMDMSFIFICYLICILICALTAVVQCNSGPNE